MNLTMICAILYIALILGTFLIVKCTKNNEKAYKVYGLVLMALMPIFFFFVVETAMGTGFTLANIGKLKFLLNCWWYFLFEALFFVLFARVSAALIGGAVLSAIFGAVNIYLMEFTTMPIYATDLTEVGTAANVAGNYTLDLSRGILLLIGLVLTMVITGFLYGWKKLFSSKMIRILMLPAFIGLFLFSFWFTTKSAYVKQHGVKISSYKPIKSYRNNGGILTFVRSFSLLYVEAPEGYSGEAVNAITERYISDSVSKEAARPNVIVIMDEAFTDLQSVGSFETSEEVMPFYNSLSENTIKGLCYMSVFGGHTANSEYEFLTGDSYAFSPAGTTPYQLYIKNAMANLTANLVMDSYQGNIAMHPYMPSGYNRVSVYNDFGFSTFLSLSDFRDARLVRKYVSDEADFDRIIAEYEAAKSQSDEPFYLFNVTMQNHSGYDTAFDNLSETIRVTSGEFSDIDITDVERFLNLVHLSDQALEKLITYFAAQEDPTVIVFFGDHEPGVTNAFYNTLLTDEVLKEDSMAKYKTPFLIWANFDIEEESGVITSANYLQSMMLEATGMKMTGYNKYLLDLRKEIPAICAQGYYTSDGSFYRIDDSKSPYAEKVNEYAMLTYNHLFDDNNTVNEFFLLKEAE